MSKKILFFPDVYLEQGHWLPAITLAQSLIQMGHQVEFMGIADCESVVTPYGLKYNTIFLTEYPLGYTRSHQHKSISERWKPVHLWNIMNGGLDKLMDDVKPDLIISGYFSSLETLLMHYKYGKEFMITTTYLRHPDDDPGIRGIQNLVGMSAPMSRKIMESVYPRNADFDKLNINLFVKPLEAVTELVPCPRIFEFDNYKFDTDTEPVLGRVHFIEPCVTRTRKVTVPPQDPWAGWKDIPVDKVAKKHIIFATAGSQVQDYKDKARRWFQEMIHMMDLQGMQDYHLVISVGPDLIKEDWVLPENVTVYQWVPQLDLLQKCAVAYIHGGLATIKECVYYAVPFVILPLGKDQMDNALRIRRKAIGLVSFAEAVGYDTLQSLFLQATTNKWTQTRLENMRDIFQKMEADKPGAILIDNFLKSH